MSVAGGQHALLAKLALLEEVEEKMKTPGLTAKQLEDLDFEKSVWMKNSVRVYDFPGERKLRRRLDN